MAKRYYTEEISASASFPIECSVEKVLAPDFLSPSTLSCCRGSLVVDIPSSPQAPLLSVCFLTVYSSGQDVMVERAESSSAEWL
jgi:hypothetical protein